jgi:hypothetical protein
MVASKAGGIFVVGFCAPNVSFSCGYKLSNVQLSCEEADVRCRESRAVLGRL